MIETVGFANPPVVSSTPTDTPASSWTALQCWALRVAVVYFLLDAIPDLLIKVPGGPTVLLLYWKVWNPVLSWFGGYVLHATNPAALRLPTAPVLLGDFAGGYVLMLLFWVIAMVVGAVWTVVAPREVGDRLLFTWLRVYVRYALAFSMFGYGMSKLFHVQFGSLDLVDWMTPLGMLQSRELLWRFMAFSPSYVVFAGIVELVGASLLFSRRTTPLGAFLLIGALGNVLMLDISYGVQVRRIALRLLLMALFLAAADLWKLVSLFLLRRTVAPTYLGEPFPGPVWVRRLAGAAKAVIIVYLVCSQSWEYYEERKLVAVTHPTLYGVYRVEQSIHNGMEDAPNDPRRWDWIVMDDGTFAVELSDANWQRRGMVTDDAKQTITVSNGPQRKSTFKYSRGGPDDVVLTGIVDEQPIELHLRQIPEPRFALNDDRLIRWSSIW